MKKQALAKYLNTNVNESEYDDCEFQTDSESYLILTEDERQQRVSDYIKDSLWAFNADFIAEHTNCNTDAFVSILELVQNYYYEELNPIIEGLIIDIDEFIEDAINADGYAHFLATYDGKEIELENDLYAYKL